MEIAVIQSKIIERRMGFFEVQFLHLKNKAGQKRRKQIFALLVLDKMNKTQKYGNHSNSK